MPIPIVKARVLLTSAPAWTPQPANPKHPVYYSSLQAIVCIQENPWITAVKQAVSENQGSVYYGYYVGLYQRYVYPLQSVYGYNLLSFFPKAPFEFFRPCIALAAFGCQNYGPFWGPYYNTAPII